MHRSMKPNEERIAELDAKIDFHKRNITALEGKKQSILSPKTRQKKVTYKSVGDLAKSNGITPEQLLKMIESNN